MRFSIYTMATVAAVLMTVASLVVAAASPCGSTVGSDPEGCEVVFLNQADLHAAFESYRLLRNAADE